MDSTDNDVYEYDKSLFFKLLESNKFRSKFEAIQEQQGVVVCPLEIKNRPFNSADLIEKHLFLPSPYYKNHFVPLIYARAGSRLSTSIHTPEFNVNLITNDNSNSDFNLICNGKPICTNVKLLKTETAYSAENSRPYRILVVDRELVYGANKTPVSQDGSDENMIDSDLAESEKSSSDAIKKRGSSVSLTTGLVSLKDVSTFPRAIDFLHNTVCVIDESVTSNNVIRRTEFANNGVFKRLNKVTVGENFLEEIELFKKTYFILHTHLNDFTSQAQKLFAKYTGQFGRALFVNSVPVGQIESFDCIVAVACEIALNGCLFSKLWPVVLKANERDDTRLCNRMSLIRIRLGLDSSVEEDLDEASVSQCVEFFRIDRVFFGVNLKPVVKELRKVELLNNPFERLESIKTSVDLLVNELTVKKRDTYQNETLMVTSENLIPLMAFVLLRSNMAYLKSVVYFVDNFSFSSSLPHAANNSNLAELAYFMATFKASISFIEDS